jgi:hypothetical protein
MNFFNFNLKNKIIFKINFCELEKHKKFIFLISYSFIFYIYFIEKFLKKKKIKNLNDYLFFLTLKLFLHYK